MWRFALENGAIKPDDTFEDPGSIKIGIHTIKNAEKTGYRRLTIPEILQTSSNIGMVRIIQRLKPSIILQLARTFRTRTKG